MPLLKAFSKVDSIEVPVSDRMREGGKIFIPSHIRGKVGLFAGRSVKIKIIRIKGSSRWPYIIIHTDKSSPRLTKLQVIMMEDVARMDNEAGLILKPDILEEVKLKAGYRVEIKVAGPDRGAWLTIHNRGTNKLTTLQEKIGRLGKGGKKWKSMTIEY